MFTTIHDCINKLQTSFNEVDEKRTFSLIYRLKVLTENLSDHLSFLDRELASGQQSRGGELKFPHLFKDVLDPLDSIAEILIDFYKFPKTKASLILDENKERMKDILVQHETLLDLMRDDNDLINSWKAVADEHLKSLQRKMSALDAAKKDLISYMKKTK